MKYPSGRIPMPGRRCSSLARMPRAPTSTGGELEMKRGILVPVHFNPEQITPPYGMCSKRPCTVVQSCQRGKRLTIHEEHRIGSPLLFKTRSFVPKSVSLSVGWSLGYVQRVARLAIKQSISTFLSAAKHPRKNCTHIQPVLELHSSSSSSSSSSPSCDAFSRASASSRSSFSVSLCVNARMRSAAPVGRVIKSEIWPRPIKDATIEAPTTKVKTKR